MSGEESLVICRASLCLLPPCLDLLAGSYDEGRGAYGVERGSVSCRGLARGTRVGGRLLTSSHDARCSWVDIAFLVTKTARISIDSTLTPAWLTA